MVLVMPIEFPLGPRSGSELRRIYQKIFPFEEKGKLKPGDSLITLLASNSNYPNTIQTEAFMQASALGEGSPQIIQYSYSSTGMEGGDQGKMKLDFDRVSDINPFGLGAWIANVLLHKYASIYGADMVFMSLDHFTSPKCDKKDIPVLEDRASFLKDKEGTPDYELARTQLINASRVLRPIIGDGAELSDDQLKTYIAYMLSPQYRAYRNDFISAVRYGRPAWAMMDTGNLPVVLNFATSRDLASRIRSGLNNLDVMIEAEIAATGQSGEELRYTYWRDLSEDERAGEIALVLAFVGYVGADAISYEIGMEHAAKAGVAHEPDKEKLMDIQWALYERTGRHIPFAQHGGTGSSEILRGLVGKYNINTAYLHTGTTADASWVKEHQEGIKNRVKSAVGTGRDLYRVARVRETCLGYLEKTNSLNMAPLFREILGTKKPSLGTYEGIKLESTE